METQIGTIARRTFRNAKGLVIKDIFYSRKSITSQLYTEDMLAVQTIVIYEYNDRNLRIKSETYDAGMTLLHRWETNYNDPIGKREVKFSSAGIREYEIRYREKSSASHLYYDEQGKNLVAIRGLIPQDVDLSYGWGESNNGLACGITRMISRSSIDDSPVQAIYVNIKNTGPNNIELHNLRTTEFELRNNAGAIVREKAGIAEKGDPLQKSRYLNGPHIPTGECAFLYPAFELPMRYEKLPPGRYSIRARQPIDDRGISLVSNIIYFDVRD